MRRRKTPFEKWFSFGRHRRRFGADAAAAQLQAPDVQALKQALVQGDAPQYAHGASVDLREHLQRLRREFIGQPELLYHHAMLIVLIRREVDTRVHYARFRQLWLAEADFLLRHLNLRWLVSACDTFIDHDGDATLKAILMNGVLLVNTVKLQETERFLCRLDDLRDQPASIDALRQHRVGLFDGLSAFIAGTDDTLRNMRWRLEDVCRAHPLGRIVMAIFERLQLDANGNVYSRFKQRHTRDKTRWW
ncbi:hypothetical protein PY257_12960 [Ramlibacter sp. H39-3-26]|uniref:hypothetical protein n=1 Tax=Curvibacter soli TaxID=3031331 RepID=UPI0023DC3ED5|nr:hypothetical protein [Ramlibacter sp. H39-3-26]MDF1486080.1 hypothetical protein [Ramlibacter sp. H39-3-26]